MPEICEVCLTSQYLSSMVNDKITKIKILSGRYVKTPIKHIDDLEFSLKIKSINTKGKFMWFELSHGENKYYMMNTFGLTGKWSFDKLESNRVEFTIQSKTQKYKLYYSDIRNFGTIEFTQDKKILDKKLNKLADDFLQSPMSDTDFESKIKNFKNKNKKLVIVLMSQDKSTGLGSGLGNYLVPEILYRAKLSPHRTIKSLTQSEIIELNHAIQHQLKLCYVDNNTDYIAHLNDFLKTHKKNIKDGKFPNYLNNIKIGKEKFQFNVYRRKTDNNGNPVIGDIIIPKRTTYWCPTIQV